MAKFTVTLETSATHTVTVEADSFKDAVEQAHEKSELYTNINNSFELGDVVVGYICNEETGEEHEEDSILSGVDI